MASKQRPGREAKKPAKKTARAKPTKPCDQHPVSRRIGDQCGVCGHPFPRRR